MKLKRRKQNQSVYIYTHAREQDDSRTVGEMKTKKVLFSALASFV